MARPPPRSEGKWRIELRYKPLGHRGHAFLVLKDDKGRVQGELNGMAKSRHTGEVVDFGFDSSQLMVLTKQWFGNTLSKLADVAAGSYDEIARGTWARGLQAAREITDKNFDHKSHDPRYEFGSEGGEIQNSNSVAYTLGLAMGLDLDRVVREAGEGRRFSGWNRNLLDPGYGPISRLRCSA